MCETIDAEFEGRVYRLPKAYDYYLNKRYGDYMKIPPKEKQVLSMYSQLDYGPYIELTQEKH